MEDRYVETVLGRIRLRVDGSGPAMPCWPSLLMDGMLWAGQAAHFTDRYQVVLVDPPGHGGSSPVERDFGFDECAQVIVQIIDALGIDRVHLIGNSWGGMIGGTFPVAETQVVADAIPGAEFVVLENAAHLAALECPDEVNALIDGFLRDHS